MLDPDLAFSLAGLVAIIGWLTLLAALFVERVRPLAWQAGLAIPGLIAIAYVLLIVEGMAAGTGGGFGSIAEVRLLFGNDAALAAGWLHYLAFDLFVGAWIARTGVAAQLSRLILIPSLVLTFLFGPAGLLLFLLLRALTGKRNAEAAQA